jgi:hypothetical protein
MGGCANDGGAAAGTAAAAGGGGNGKGFGTCIARLGGTIISGSFTARPLLTVPVTSGTAGGPLKGGWPAVAKCCS